MDSIAQRDQLLVVRATIASCVDFDDIAAWAKSHFDFLRRILH